MFGCLIRHFDLQTSVISVNWITGPFYPTSVSKVEDSLLIRNLV